jgi:O-antigen ligase
VSRPAPAPAAVRRSSVSNRHELAYRGLLVFTVLLYLRPNELLPIGTFPIVKILTIGTLLAFFFDRLSQGGPLSVMPKPFRHLLTVAVLAVLSIPVGINPTASFNSFIDLFLKILLIFLLIINVVTSFRRLRLMMEVIVLSGAGVALLTLIDFVQGKNLVEGIRAAGATGGIFANPNDLALAMNVLLPLSIGLMLSRPSPASKLVFFVCAALLAVTTVVTYSRSGLLTIVIASGFMVLKLGRRYPALWVVGGVALIAVVATSPGRVLTIFEGAGDESSAAGSATMRWELVKRSIEVAGANPIRWLLGVGLNNFHIVSHKELVSHNAYLEVFNELGLPALCFYVLFLVSAFRMAGRVVKAHRKTRGARQLWLVAVAIQTSLFAYIVGGFFASVAFQWYVYYPAAFAVCLYQLVARAELQPRPREVTSRVWYLRRAQP